jgi:hypothetical protein
MRKDVGRALFADGNSKSPHIVEKGMRLSEEQGRK